MQSAEPLLVVLGIDKNKKPRAAVFGAQDAAAAKRAVAAMGLRIGRAETPEAIALAKQLPKGKVFASGKGLLPRVKQPLLDKLLKVVDIIEPPSGETAGSAASLDQGTGHIQAENNVDNASYKNPWDAITVGSTVLWCADRDEGWFPCTVTEVGKDKKLLTVKWRDFAGFKPFRVKRLAVGLVSKLH